MRMTVARLMMISLIIVVTVSLNGYGAVAAKVVLSPMLTAPNTVGARFFSTWQRMERANADDLVTLTIGVKQQHVDQLQQLLLQVSDPSSPQYGQHWTLEKVQALLAPAVESVQLVLTWLQQNGIPKSSINHSPTFDWISATVSYAQAEQLLHTQYFRFRHAASGEHLTRCLSYELPDDVSPHIQVIGPTIRFGRGRSVLRSRTGGSTTASFSEQLVSEPVRGVPPDSCSSSITPSCLATLYNTTGYVSSSTANSLAVTGFLQQYMSVSDLQLFFQNLQPSSLGRMPNIIGPNDQSMPSSEASLDIQYSMSIALGVNTTFWSTAGSQPKNPDNEPFLAFLQDLSNSANPPFVISTSYGEDEDTDDFDYAVRMNTEFAAGGVRGISFLFSSGDSGVASDSGSCTVFVPQYPATSPYVTAVGATSQLPEQGAAFSSGGFSNYWPQQSWQTSAISTYMVVAHSTLPNATLYNISGRGFPDVSAFGVDFEVIVDGESTSVAGTSCSSPTFAGVVALLNDVRLKAGKSTLGFLNPLLYKHPEVFNDITLGSNPGCNTSGFYAAQGWDPVTGLGTPDFAKMSALVSSLP